MTEARRTKFYRNKQDGKLFGVCAGISDYTGVDTLWVRIGTVLLAFATGWIILAYLVVGFLASKRPRELFVQTPEQQKFWQGVRAAPGRSIRDIRSTFRDIDRRLADVEVYVTNSNRQLANEIDSLR